MDKQQFKDFCKKEFLSHGFKKQKNVFYRAGEEVLCSLDLQRSNFGPIYYINYKYYIGDYRQATLYPTVYDMGVSGRFIVMSKKDRINGKCFETSEIEYEEYTEEELKPYFDKAFEEIILPALQHGKAYILKYLGVKYRLTIHQAEVMEQLQS